MLATWCLLSLAALRKWPRGGYFGDEDRTLQPMPPPMVALRDAEDVEKERLLIAGYRARINRTDEEPQMARYDLCGMCKAMYVHGSCTTPERATLNTVAATVYMYAPSPA